MIDRGSVLDTTIFDGLAFFIVLSEVIDKNSRYGKIAFKGCTGKDWT
jgi:hypothetical protein